MADLANIAAATPAGYSETVLDRGSGWIATRLARSCGGTLVVDVNSVPHPQALSPSLNLG